LQKGVRKMKEAALGIVNDSRWLITQGDCPALSSEIGHPYFDRAASSGRLTALEKPLTLLLPSPFHEIPTHRSSLYSLIPRLRFLSNTEMQARLRPFRPCKAGPGKAAKAAHRQG